MRNQQFSLVEGKKTVSWKARKQAAYHAAYCRMLQKMLEEEQSFGIKQFVFLSLRARKEREKPETFTEAKEEFLYYETLMAMIGTLTPVEMEQVFPITKQYDGDKYECKDYFFTKNLLRQLPPDRPIKESMEVMEFLWDYQNPDIRHFVIGMTCTISALQALQGKETSIDYLNRKWGVTSVIKYADGIYMDPKTGKLLKAKKCSRKPKYLVAIQGRKP